MTADDDAKADLRTYLQAGRDALLWKLEGLSEYDVRRPMTPTGTNLLGLLKHLAFVEMGYFGPTFGRPVPEVEPWIADDGASPTGTCGPRPTSRGRTSSRSTAGPGRSPTPRSRSWPLDAAGQVPWWRPDRRTVTLHQILVHVIAETHRHAGHADIVRELIDGSVGNRGVSDNLPERDEGWWAGLPRPAGARRAGRPQERTRPR